VSEITLRADRMRGCKILGAGGIGPIFWVHGKWTGLVAKLVWRAKLMAEVRLGMETETEVARIERDEDPGLADLGPACRDEATCGCGCAAGGDRAGAGVHAG